MCGLSSICLEKKVSSSVVREPLRKEKHSSKCGEKITSPFLHLWKKTEYVNYFVGVHEVDDW